MLRKDRHGSTSRSQSYMNVNRGALKHECHPSHTHTNTCCFPDIILKTTLPPTSSSSLAKQTPASFVAVDKRRESDPEKNDTSSLPAARPPSASNTRPKSSSSEKFEAAIKRTGTVPGGCVCVCVCVALALCGTDPSHSLTHCHRTGGGATPAASAAKINKIKSNKSSLRERRRAAGSRRRALPSLPGVARTCCSLAVCVRSLRV